MSEWFVLKHGKMSALEVVDILNKHLRISSSPILVKRFVSAFRKSQMSVRSKESMIYLQGFFMCYGVPTCFVFLYI